MSAYPIYSFCDLRVFWHCGSAGCGQTRAVCLTYDGCIDRGADGSRPEARLHVNDAPLCGVCGDALTVARSEVTCTSDGSTLECEVRIIRSGKTTKISKKSSTSTSGDPLPALDGHMLRYGPYRSSSSGGGERSRSGPLRGIIAPYYRFSET